MEEAVKANDYGKFKEVASMRKNAGNYGGKDVNAGDTVLRKVVLECTIAGITPEKLDDLLTITLNATKDELCSRPLAGLVALDAMELSPLSMCEPLFDVFAKHEELWRADPIYPALKPSVLRVCNSIIKRLSPQGDSQFSGKIIKFLAQRLPLCEPSGLNKPGVINNEYTTTWQEFKEESIGNGGEEEKQTDAGVESMETDDLEQGEIKEEEGPSLPPDESAQPKPEESAVVPLDEKLYAKFWRMQNFFASPNDPYDTEKFDELKDCLEAIFEAFRSHKVQKRRRRKRAAKSRNDPQEGIYEADDLLEGLDQLCAVEPGTNFDAKRDELFCVRYFTDFEFFEQQMLDIKMRRSFLVQCLILFQYLLTEAKIKDKSFKLTETQKTFVTEANQTCYDMLAEKGSFGNSAKYAARFAESVKNVMDREEYWIKWKNQGGHAWTLDPLPDNCPMPVYKRRPRQKFSFKEIDLGNPSMTRIWSNSNNILDECAKRNFYPKAKEFLSEPLEELDPDSQIEEGYMSVHNDDFQFRTSRYLSRQGPAYWMCNSSNLLVDNIVDYLKTAVVASAKDVPELREQATEIEKRIAEKAAIEKAKQAVLKAQQEKETAEKAKQEAKLEAVKKVRTPIKAPAPSPVPEKVEKTPRSSPGQDTKTPTSSRSTEKAEKTEVVKTPRSHLKSSQKTPTEKLIRSAEKTAKSPAKPKSLDLKSPAKVKSSESIEKLDKVSPVSSED